MPCSCAYDGEEALEMIRQKEYDIILLDVMLPKVDGYELMNCQINGFVIPLYNSGSCVNHQVMDS